MTWEYFKPEAHGLVHVGAVDWLAGEGCYEWSETTIMYHPETQRFFWENDGGCSCDGPLDNVNTLDDLTSGTLHDLWTEVMSDLKNYEDSKNYEHIAADVVETMSACLRVKDEGVQL
jgi:hypothetical protein